MKKITLPGKNKDQSNDNKAKDDNGGPNKEKTPDSGEKTTGTCSADDPSNKPRGSFHELRAKTLEGGEDFDFSTLKGKVVLVENTASL